MSADNTDQQKKGETKTCPYCAETIKKEALICRFCGINLATGEPVRTSADSAMKQILEKGVFIRVRPISWGLLLLGLAMAVIGFLSMSTVGFIGAILGLLLMAWAIDF